MISSRRQGEMRQLAEQQGGVTMTEVRWLPLLCMYDRVLILQENSSSQ